MKTLLESGSTWTSGKIQAIVANFDPEVLERPGGIVVAMLICICATIAVVLGGQSK